jgi:two-component system, chemotaxis family, response regulator Rcp1
MRQLEVLAVEDNPADLGWLNYVMDKSGLKYRITVANDGAKAVDFLTKRGLYVDVPKPDLILLDVHLPKVTGYEALRQIPNARELPICVLTSSEAERDLFRKEFGIEGAKYLIKPVSPEALLACLRSYDHLRPIAEALSGIG